MSSKPEQTLLGALGALALGGSAIAGAASDPSTATTAATSTQAGSSSSSSPSQPPAGAHVGAIGERDQALTGDVAARPTTPRSRFWST